MFRLYDTRHRQVDEIQPAGGRLLRMYTCGPAVDRYAHVGDLRAYLLSDLIRRTAQRHALTVISCQNVTDVGHLAGHGEIHPTHEGKREGKTAADPQIGRHFQDAFRADCAALNIHPADHAPRTSESIGLMIELIEKLLESGHAYLSADGSVFFDARSFADYGEISGNQISGNQISGDWALWQGAAGGGEPTWPAPWGTGFPGWHTECSALSLHFLGEIIDIHTGGIDLCFPHHEDVRAQCDSVTGHEVVRHWVHGEHLLFEGRRMAKSTGNVVLLAGISERGLDPLALRLALLEHSYRQQMNLTWDTLADADSTLRRWRERVAEWANSPSKPMCGQYSADIAAAFDDDLDTPAALRALRLLESDSEILPGSKFETFAHTDRLLGLDLARDVGRPAAASAAAPALPA